MRLHLTNPLLGLAVSGLLLTGCATLESETEPDWQLTGGGPSMPLVRFLSDTDASDDGSRLMVANTDDVYVIDGETGDYVATVGSDGGPGDSRHVQVRVRDVTYTLDEATATVRMLPESNRLIIFDYDDFEAGAERITAVDLASGEAAWHHTDYRYSLQQYEQLVDQATQEMGETLGRLLGGQGRGESVYNQRERERHFMRHTVATVDDGDGILFKTFDGLVKLNADNGHEEWRVEEFRGPGIETVETLENGDYLVLSTGADLSRLQAASEYSLARLSPDGEVRWISEHSGQRVGHLVVAEGHAAVDAWPLQVFDLDSGEKRWENDVLRQGVAGNERRSMPQPPPLIEDGVLYQAATSHKADEISIGYPHKIHAYDLTSGDVLWATEEVDAYFGELDLLQGTLVVWGAGEFFNDDNSGGVVGLDPATGEPTWASPALSSPGTISMADWIQPPIVGDQQEQLFVAGPEELHGIDIASGDVVMDIDLAAAQLGTTVGLIRHEDDLVAIGEDGVAAFAMDTGAERFQVATEHVNDFHYAGDRLVLEVGPGGVMAMAERQGGSPNPPGSTLESEALEDLVRWQREANPDPLGPDGFSEDPAGVAAVDLTTGSLGSLAAWQGRPWVFGPLRGTGVVVDEEGRYAWIIDENGALVRYSL